MLTTKHLCTSPASRFPFPPPQSDATFNNNNNKWNPKSKELLLWLRIIFCRVQRVTLNRWCCTMRKGLKLVSVHTRYVVCCMQARVMVGGRKFQNGTDAIWNSHFGNALGAMKYHQEYPHWNVNTPATSHQPPAYTHTRVHIFII